MGIRKAEKNALWFGFGCCLSEISVQVVRAWLDEMRDHVTFPLLLDDENTMKGAFMLVLGTSSREDAHSLGVAVLSEWVKMVSPVDVCVLSGSAMVVMQRWRLLRQIAYLTGLCVDLSDAQFLLLQEENGKL